jgi:mannosylglycoprotein endo-beta-mannosidase
MKLISYNTRGLGGKAKKADIRKLISDKNPDLISIQESKLEIVDRRLCESLWGLGDFDFAYKESDGRSGGLITIWDASLFKLISVVELNYAQLMEGI